MCIEVIVCYVSVVFLRHSVETECVVAKGTLAAIIP